MTTVPRSLLSGRNRSPLTDQQRRSVEEDFRALGYDGPLDWEEYGWTRFTPRTDDQGRTFGVVVIGPDILPGRDVTNPNAALDQMAAAAHELEHMNRWRSGRSLDVGHLDEAMTSLQAACTYGTFLTKNRVEQLISDALQRLVLLKDEGTGGAPVAEVDENE